MNLEVLQKNKTCLLLVGVCLLWSEHTLSAQRPVDVYAPPEAITIFDGNSYAIPFDTAGRFQQVYDASVFSSRLSRLPGGGGFVRQLLFRGDANIGHSFIATLRSVQLNLSTTLKSPDGLSSTFDDNVGSDDSVVLGPQSVLIVGGGGGGVTGFDLFFDLRDHPFYYNPANGNLLVDVRVHQGFDYSGPLLGVAILDSFTTFGDAISSVYAPEWSSLTDGEVSTLGLATDFVFVPVPELAVSLQSTNLMLTWPVGLAGFKLEQSPVLGAGASWQPAGGIITTNRPTNSSIDMVVVTLPHDRTATGRFFRLHWQSSSPAAGSEPNNESSAVLK